MKHIIQRGLLLTAFVFGLFFRMSAQSTQIVVFLNNGSEQTYSLIEADRLYFEDNTKLVIEQISTKSTVIIPLADSERLRVTKPWAFRKPRTRRFPSLPTPFTMLSRSATLWARKTSASTPSTEDWSNQWKLQETNPLTSATYPLGCISSKLNHQPLK